MNSSRTSPPAAFDVRPVMMCTRAGIRTIPSRSYGTNRAASAWRALIGASPPACDRSSAKDENAASANCAALAGGYHREEDSKDQGEGTA